MGRATDFAGSAVPCPECGTAGKPDTGNLLRHCETPGHCHTYTWTPGGQTVARDVNTKADRDAAADRFDSRLKSLVTFGRKR